MAGVVADDEGDLAAAAGVVADQLGDVDAGHGVGRTVHEADTAQLPQSIRPVGAVSFRHAGWVCGSVAVGSMFETTLRAPSPW